MNAKITRVRLDKHMEYDWFKYILVLIAAILLWLGIYSVLDNPKDHETIDFFVSVNKYHDDNSTQGETKMLTEVHNILQANQDTVIRKVNVVYFANQMQYSTTAMTCDFFIGVEETVKFVDMSFLPLDAEVLGLIGIDALDYEFYFHKDKEEETPKAAEVPCAIRLKGDKLNDWLPKTITVKEKDENGVETEKEVEQKYYIGFVANNMVGGGGNIGKFNAKKKSTDNVQAFYIAKHLLEYYA